MPQKKLLDLPDDVLLRIFHSLGFTSDLSTRTLRKVAHAFILAQTCQRLLNVFCNAITSIDTQLTPRAPPPGFHPTHQAPHVHWLLRHARQLKSLKLSLDTSHALLALPCDSNLKELELGFEYDGTAPRQLPSTLTKLKVVTPSCGFVSLLRTVTFCALTELHIYSLYPDQIPDFLIFFKHRAKSLKDLVLSFFLPSENDSRERENHNVTTAIRTICESCTSTSPKISSLHFSVTGDSRCDTDWDTFEAYKLQPLVEKLRNHQPSSLLAVGVLTDIDLLSDWVDAISPAISHTTWVMAEAALNCVIFPPSFISVTPIFAHVRIMTDITGQLPRINELLASPAPLNSIYITDRSAIDMYCRSPEHRKLATLRYAEVLSPCDNIWAAVPFGVLATNFGIYNAEDVQNVIANLSVDPSEAPATLAYSFFCKFFTATCGANTVELSFDCVSYAQENESMVESMLSHLPDLEELRLVMPVEGQGSSREIEGQGSSRGGLVNATPGFLTGLPVFLRLLEGACVNLRYVYLQDIGTMAWNNEDEKDLLLGAEHALCTFERARPCVHVDSIRAVLQYWKRV